MTTDFRKEDLKDYFEKLAEVLFHKERDLKAVYYRAEDKSLSEVGNIICASREKIRQTELRAAKALSEHQTEVKNLIYCIQALNGNKSLIKLDEAIKFLGENAKIIFYLADKGSFNNEEFHFDKELQAFVFNTGGELDLDELTENLPELMTEATFEATVKDLAHEKNSPAELVRATLLKVYKQTGKMFYRGKLMFAHKCDYILKEYFPDGYKVGDAATYSRFISILQDIFGNKVLPTQRNVDAKMGVIGVLCARGKHIHPDFVHVPPEIIARVKDFIDSSKRTAIFYKEIFEALKEHFIGTQITNHYFLQGVIRLYKLPYTLRKDYLTKSDEINVDKEFADFVAERGEVSNQELRENFISFQNVNINFLIKRCPEVIRIGDGLFMHSSRLSLREDDLDAIKDFLQEVCLEPVHLRVLFELFKENFPDFMTRNKIQTPVKLFGVLRYMFSDEFTFSQPYISTADAKEVNHKKVLLRLLEGTDEITKDELIHKMDYVPQGYLFELLRPEFIRAGEKIFRRAEAIGITDEVISAVGEVIQAAIERNGGWQTAQAFKDYDSLPQLKIPWNSFLLEEVASLADNAPYKIRNPHTPKIFSAAVFVSKEFTEDDFESFLLKVLIAEHMKQPVRTEEEIFSALKTQGLAN